MWQQIEPWGFKGVRVEKGDKVLDELRSKWKEKSVSVRVKTGISEGTAVAPTMVYEW